MDEKVLEEGMTWRELFRRLREKVEMTVRVKVDETTWIDLLLLLFNKRLFFSLRRESIKEKSVVKEGTSKKVLDFFLEKAWETPILKSRNI
jgi:hypothetical protein